MLQMKKNERLKLKSFILVVLMHELNALGWEYTYVLAIESSQNVSWDVTTSRGIEGQPCTQFIDQVVWGYE